MSSAKLTGIAVLLGAVLVAPSFLIPLHRSFYRRHYPQYAESWPNNGHFTHFAVYGAEGEDESFYAARVKEASRHFLPFDPYVKEDRSVRQMLRDVLGFMFLGALQRLTRDLNATWVLARLLLVPLFFLLVYRSLLRAGSRERPAVFFAATLTLFSDLTVGLIGFDALRDVPKVLIRKSFWLLGGEPYFFGPTRLLNDCLTLPALLLAALLTVETARSLSGPRAVVSGLVGGLLAYVHTNVWGVYAIAAFVYWLLSSAEGRSIHRPLLLSGAVTALLSAPWPILNHPMDPDLLQRCAAIFGRRVSPLSFLYLAGAALLLKRAAANPMRLWCVSVLFAVFLALNLSLVTGYNIIAFEWAFNGNLFLLIVLCGIWGARLKDGSHWLWLTSLVVLLGLCREISYSAQTFKNYAIPRHYEEAFSWLDRNTAQDEVVATLNGEVNLLLPVYTHNRTLVARNQPIVSDVTNAENAERLSFAVDLLVPPRRRQQAVRTLLSPPDSRIVTDQMWQGSMDRAQLDRLSVGRIFAGLDHFLTHDAIYPLVQRTLSRPAGKSYAVDYLWVGDFENSLSGGENPSVRRSSAELVYRNPAVSIYRLRGG